MYWLLIGYLFLYIHRPFEVWTILGTVRIELVYMLFTGAVWLAYPKKKLNIDPLFIAVGALAAAVVVCSFVSPWADKCFDWIDSWIKLLVFFLMIVTVVQDEVELRFFILALLVVMTGYMVHSLLEYHGGRFVYRMGICRLMGIDTTSDPNSFAMSIVLTLVFVPTLWRCYTGPLTRVFFCGYTALSFLCVSLTGSRGAFLAILLWAGIAAWRSKWRVPLAAAGIAAAPLLFMALPESLQTRFETIVDSNVGPKNAKTSADGRVEGFLVGMQLWQDNPLVGVGPGAWLLASKRALRAHNLYGQVAGEMGALGVLTLLGVVAGYILNIRAIRRLADPNGLLVRLAGCLGVALVLLLFGGTFGHNLFRAHWVLYAALLIVARRCAAEQASVMAYGDDYAIAFDGAEYHDESLAPVASS